MSASLTMAGAAVSTGVLAVNVRSWWKSNREPKAAIPFAGGLVQGASWTLCTGGLLGWVAVRTAGADSAAGDGALSRVTGQSGGALAHGSMGTLTPAGACVVVVTLPLGYLMWKAAGKGDKRKIVGGLFVGLTLTFTAGFAQVMQWVPDVYNAIGGGAEDLLNGVLPL